MKVIPLGHNVLAKLYKKEEQTEGGIIIPETTRYDTMAKGKVLKVGDEVTKVKPGDYILIDNTAPIQHIGDKDNLEFILSQNIIIAIFIPERAEVEVLQ